MKESPESSKLYPKPETPACQGELPGIGAKVADCVALRRGEKFNVGAEINTNPILGVPCYYNCSIMGPKTLV